ncbi:MAG: hypothetical protein ACI8QP_001274 [Porticoccaceae bacterium]|jgi:hypothetical protein
MENHNNSEFLHKDFISKLVKRYGAFNNTSKKFESTSNSKIARDLFYSDSQFSRLVNGTASEGEFKRALGNIKRLLDLDQLNKKTQSNKNTPTIKRIFIFLISGLLLSLITVSFLYFKKGESITKSEILTDDTRYEMLKWGFENNYIQPYVKLKELPDDCYYPCYKYQGRWKLKNIYKIPFFRERNGFHYVAKEAIMYARCMDERDDSGEYFEGYEYQKHELWYDKRELPIDSFMTKGSNTKIIESYNLSNLKDDNNFVKIAYVHTFFRTEFKIDSTLIHRTGKAIGRDIEFVSDEILKNQLNKEVSLAGIKDEIKDISMNRLEDYSKPITCKPTLAPDANFNLIEEGDELNFNCHFSIGRFDVEYNKTYIFDDQYINNNCR